jgi:hypothetical protein
MLLPLGDSLLELKIDPIETAERNEAAEERAACSHRKRLPDQANCEPTFKNVSKCSWNSREAFAECIWGCFLREKK